MVTFTIAPDVRFHVGTTLFVYPANGSLLISTSPVTSSVVGADSRTTFLDLTASTRYAAGPSVNGPFVWFRTPAAAEDDDETPTGGGDRMLLWDADEEAYSRPELWADTSAPRIFIGPAEAHPIGIGEIVGPVYGDLFYAIEPPE